MNLRIPILLTVGCICLLLSFWLSKNVVRLHSSYDKWQADRQVVKAMDRHYEEMIAGVQTEKEKRILIHEHHFIKHAREHDEIASAFQLADGVDEFEAFLLARIYLWEKVGACSYADLPELKGDNWIIPISVGRKSVHAPEDPPIIINAKTGSLTCEGNPSVSDPILFLQTTDHRNSKSTKTPKPPATT